MTPPPLSHHFGHGVLGHEKAALEVDGDDAVPCLFGEFVGGEVAVEGLDADVVDQDVDATAGGSGLVHQRLAD